MNIDMTPRVTLEGDIILDLNARQQLARRRRERRRRRTIPSFVQRKVTTRLRLRDGESNLLAGLLREDERKTLTGFPGAIHVPILKQLFSNNDSTISQTDIVMLLTPHIVRTNEITEADLRPIYIGSQQNLGLGGPPPLIAGRRPRPTRWPLPAAAGPRSAEVAGDGARRAGKSAADAARHRRSRRRPGRRRCPGRSSCRSRHHRLSRTRPAPPVPPAPPPDGAAAIHRRRRRRPAPPAPAPALEPTTPPGVGHGAGADLAAGHRVPRRRRAVHRADLDRRTRRGCRRSR